MSYKLLLYRMWMLPGATENVAHHQILLQVSVLTAMLYSFTSR